MFLNSSTLASLRFFEAAARLLSFKQAALELHVTQGAVSQQIKHLEAALGCTLFNRLSRQLTLTGDGQRFAAVVELALEQIEEAARALSAASAKAEVRLRAGPSFALRWLVPRLGDFYARHSHIQLFIAAAHGYFDPARREFDIAIELIEGPPPMLECEVLMEEYLIPVCSPAYLAAHAFLKDPQDLARCTLLHDGHAWAGAEQNEEWRHWLGHVGAGMVDSNQGQFFSLANLAIEAALNHQGVAMGRDSLIRESLAGGELVAPFERWITSPKKYCLLYPKAFAHRPGVQAVIRWLQAQATDWSNTR